MRVVKDLEVAVDKQALPGVVAIVDGLPSRARERSRNRRSGRDRRRAQSPPPGGRADDDRACRLWVIVLVKSAIVLLVVITTFAYSMLFERKIMGWMQLRPGPNRVGPWGMMQPAADAVKMMFKEDLTPETADPLIYRLAPFISLICAMGVFAVIPFSRADGGTLGRRRRRTPASCSSSRSRRSASTASRSPAGRRARSSRCWAACARPRR